MRTDSAADIGVKDGKIVEVRGETVTTPASKVTRPRPSTPQVASWHRGSSTSTPTTTARSAGIRLLEPSSLHGVTTVVGGNCGVGFAPVRPGREQWLIELMEGVEDIPGTALTEGITWGWESFPEYLDAIEKRELAVDVGTQIAHGAVRAYAMGERGARNEEATEDDIAAMARIVQEAIEAGALGFSTSRTVGHRAMDGEPVPGTYAAEEELFGLGRAMAAGGRAVFELAPQGVAGEDLVGRRKSELDWMTTAGRRDRPAGVLRHDPGRRGSRICGASSWTSRQAHEAGIELYPQIAARPVRHAVRLPRPSRVHPPAHLPQAEGGTGPRRVGAAPGRSGRAGGDPVRGPICRPIRSVLFDGMFALVQHSANRIYAIGDPPDYEPTPDKTVAAIAEQRGEDPLATHVRPDARIRRGAHC